MLTALPVPWTLAVLLESDGDKRRIGLLPVIAIVIRSNAGQPEFEPLVVMQSGQLVRASHLKHEVLFIVQPGEDAEKIARAMFHADEDGVKVTVDHEHTEN